MKPDPLDNIPVYKSSGIHYVNIAEIPEPTQTAFRRALGSTVAQRPLVPGADAAYSWDWDLFLERWRRSN